MKKLLCLALAVLILSSIGAFAVDEPLLTDPESRYDELSEVSDGSEELIFLVLDMMNDEETLVAEHGNVRISMIYYGENSGFRTDVILYNTEYGRAEMMEVYAFDSLYAKMLVTPSGHLYNWDASGAFDSTESTVTQKTFDQTYEGFIFPFSGISMLRGVRQSEEDWCYFLVKGSDEGYLYEYVVSTNAMVLDGLREYVLDPSDGKYHLQLVTKVTYGDAQPLTSEELALVREAAQGSTKAAEGSATPA